MGKATAAMVQELDVEVRKVERTITSLERAIAVLEFASRDNAQLFRTGRVRNPPTATSAYQKVGKLLRESTKLLESAKKTLHKKASARRNALAWAIKSRK